MRHSIDCSFCYYVHYTTVMSKKQNFISALCSQRHDHEKIVYIKSLLLLRLLRRDQHYVHYALVKKKDIQFSFQHYIHYVLIKTENKFIIIPTIHSLHDKFSGTIRFVQATVISPSGISVDSYMIYYPFSPIFQ